MVRHICIKKDFNIKWRLDVLTRKWVVCFGIDMGANKFKNRKPCNFFIEVGILFWTFGFELDWW